MNIIVHDEGWHLLSDNPVQDENISVIEFKHNQKLNLVVLAAELDTPNQYIVGYVDSASRSVLSVITGTAFTGNTAIQIDYTDCIILAQVISSERVISSSQLEEKQFIVALELKEVFSRISQLESLIRGLSGNPNSRR